MTTPPESVVAFADRLCAELTRVSTRLDAAYLHGSAALGGWVPALSDVDLLLITSDDITSAELEALARALVDTSGHCPGRGLECSAVTLSQAAEPAPPWPFLLHVATGPDEPGGHRVVHGCAGTGDTDLLMHYAVCRAGGWPVRGPAAPELIGAVPRPAVLAYLADELRWGLDHAPEAYAVLNACRAAIFLTHGQIVSKIAGGESALRTGSGPADVIGRALAQQRGLETGHTAGPDAAAFVLDVAQALRAAADAGKRERSDRGPRCQR